MAQHVTLLCELEHRSARSITGRPADESHTGKCVDVLTTIPSVTKSDAARLLASFEVCVSIFLYLFLHYVSRQLVMYLKLQRLFSPLLMEWDPKKYLRSFRLLTNNSHNSHNHLTNSHLQNLRLLLPLLHLNLMPLNQSRLTH